jgi:putative protein-disulfide isomerase
MLALMTNSSDAPLTVLYDPLCGWCYGAGPALRRLSEGAPAAVTFLATGLFSGAGARAMDARFADYAWENDRRIEQLTGQRFTTAYQQQVLGASGTKLDSGPATRAIVAAKQSGAPTIDVLHAIQEARYVGGRDVTSPAVLAEILSEIGIAESAVARFLSADDALLAEVAAQAEEAARLLRAVDRRGVPTVIVNVGRSDMHPLPNEILYGSRGIGS